MNAVDSENFSHEHLDHLSLKLLGDTISKLNSNRRAFKEFDSDKFDPEFIRFIKSLKQNCEDYSMLIDILNTII